MPEPYHTMGRFFRSKSLTRLRLFLSTRPRKNLCHSSQIHYASDKRRWLGCQVEQQNLTKSDRTSAAVLAVQKGLTI
jgi:hypothetical protein